MSHVRDFNIGFISEKDPGEKNILDYSNFHIQLQNKGIVKNMMLGYYLLQFGQGLVFSAGYAPGKGSEPVYFTRRSNLGIRPYNSIVENSSFRGLATTLKLKNFELTAMVSRNKKDVTLPDSSDEFSALVYNGFHRTELEISHQNKMLEQNLGLNILYRIANIQVGFSALTTNYDVGFQKRPADYNRFEFVGKHNFVAGPNVSVAWQNFNFFGEAARSSSGGYGYIFGLVASLSSQIDWALNFRNYQPNFHTQYGSGFSEGSRTINEKGIYTGLKYTYTKSWIISTFYDSFKFPWLKYRVDFPSIGYDYQLRIQYIRNKSQNSFVAFHHETKQLNQTLPAFNTHQLGVTDRNSFVIGHEKIINKAFVFQTKFQFNSFKLGEGQLSKGYAFIQDFERKMAKFQYSCRVAYFKTDNWDSRVYTYENDVRYAVSFPAYYGNGFRFYVNAKFPISQKLTMGFRLADTYIISANSIGTGNDKIVSNHKTDVRLQLIYDFN